MKKYFINIISFLLFIIIGSHLLPFFYCENIKDAMSIPNFSILFGISKLLFVSLAFILCGWLAWLIYKIELYQKMLDEKVIDAKREDNRQDKLEHNVLTRGTFEMERNRVNDLIRIAQLSINKSETSISDTNTTKVAESKETENIITNTNNTKNEVVNFEIFTNIFREYQNIFPKPKNK